ncbi:MAG: APC family permease [Candidatus Thorarchaeota archaeon]|nr:APC family permease [Candidatus Thorarchaeota archaeon]
MSTDEGTTTKQSKVALKRDIGWFGSFAMGYADVGADIYVALGLVAAYAAGWAPVAFIIASVTYIATGLAYAELATAYPYAGGAQVYSMKAFNDFAGFLGGWLVMLDYTVCTALFAIATVGYLTFFFPVLILTTFTFSLLGLQIVVNAIGLVAFVIVLILIGINIVGIKEASTLNTTMVALNIIVLSIIMALGLLLAFNLDLFSMQITIRGAPDPFGHIAYIWSTDYSDQNFFYAVTLAMSSFIGIESIAQAAEETKRPDRTIPRATKMSIVSVLLFAVGLSAISLGMISWSTLGASLEDPISALVRSIAGVGVTLLPIVAFTGFAICLVSSNTGIIGVSRVVFSMSNFDLLPAWFSKVNSKTRTPVRTIIVFGSIGALLALIGQLDWVADLYNFGALLSYLMVNISLIVLRQTDKEAHRSWKVPFTFKLTIKQKSYDIPLPSLLGIIACSSIWLLVVIFHPIGRLLGFSWTTIGILIYAIHRRRIGKPFFSRDIGSSIKPMTYKMNALVLIRPEEREEIAESLRDSFDTRFRLTLLSVISTDKWDLPLTAAIEYKKLASLDLRNISVELTDFGFETREIVHVGSVKKVVTEAAISDQYDFVIVIRGKSFKKGKRDSIDDMISLVSSIAPGKLMVVRR